MLKYLGILLIAAVTAGYGGLCAYSLKKEALVLNGFLLLARRIRTRIECFRQPLSEIYRDFSHPALDGAGFTEELRESGFTAALCKTKNSLGLREELFALVGEFGNELGKSYSEEQVRHCERYILRMEEALVGLEEELPRRRKTVRALSAAAAVMAVILLI